MDAVLRRDGRTDAFFDGAAADRLMIRRCAACGRWAAPDASDCAGCGAAGLPWAEASGRATLVSWAISHGRPRADGSAPSPAVLALVELDEGPWLHSRLSEAPIEGLREGLPLRAHFEHPGEGESYLVFRMEDR
ncbi:MAG TPA: OB-fold domain-containing protein [Streptosporangiaceae bacterium]